MKKQNKKESLGTYQIDTSPVTQKNKNHIARCRRWVASVKYTIKEIASTIVVIIGLAITAGSKPIRSASIGSIQPMSFAQLTTITRVMHTTIVDAISLMVYFTLATHLLHLAI